MDKRCLINSIFIIIFAISVIYFYNNIYDGTISQLSNINNKEYYVRNTSDKEFKADLLGTLDEKLNIIVNSLSNEKNKSESVNRLINNWNNEVKIKEIGNMESDAAYVINKKYMSFCLKDFKSVSPEILNLLTYVGIHELSHVMSNETGHGDEFKQNFKFLLDYSKQLTYNDKLLKKQVPLYVSLNKLNTPDNYCGVSIINSIN